MPGKDLAIKVEALFLINLMLLPFIGFLGIVYLFIRHRRTAPALALNHLWQTMGVGVIGGVMLVFFTFAIAIVGGFDSGYTWVAVVIYFTFIHTSLILFGAIGLSKALSDKGVCYPLIGRWFLKHGPMPLSNEN